MRKTRLAAVAGAAFLAAVSLFSTVASAGVEKARLGALKKTDYVVVDVTGTGGSGGSYTGAVDAATLEAALTNYLASGVLVSTNDLRFLRHVTDLGVYRYTVSTNGPWTWSTDNDVLRIYLKDLTPVYVQGSAGASGHWSLDGTLPSGLSISSYDTAGPETPTVTLGFSAVLTTNAIVATATRPQFLAKSEDTLATSADLRRSSTNLLTFVAGLGDAITAVSGDIDVLKSDLGEDLRILFIDSTNNYQAARLANYRAKRLETWQWAVSNQLLLANAEAGSTTNGLKPSAYFTSDNTQLVATVKGQVADWALSGQPTPVTDLSSRTTYDDVTNITKSAAVTNAGAKAYADAVAALTTDFLQAWTESYARARTDNTAHVTSFTPWTFGVGAASLTNAVLTFVPLTAGSRVGGWKLTQGSTVLAYTAPTHTAEDTVLSASSWAYSSLTPAPTASRTCSAVPAEDFMTYGPVTSLVGRTEAAIRATVLPDDVAALTNNVRFKAAVETVSPPVTDVVFLETDSSGDKTAVTLGSRPSLADVPVWSASSTYQQNDLVTKGGVLYVCTAWPDDPVGPSSWAEQSDDGVWKPVTVGAGSFAVGATNVADGVGTTAAGGTVHAEGPFAHAEGVYTRADGAASHAEGASTRAFGTYTHAEGASAMAGGLATHAEGGTTYADGIATHAEGVLTGAGGLASHAEGYGTAALGPAAKAEGVYATAGDGSLYRVVGTVTNYVAGTHAAGWGAVATNQTAFVWQGAPADRELLGSAPETAERYYDHGAGTFNLNPVGGLQGIWIGSTNLYDHIVASSPPVVLPAKWALANVTNASGTAVSAADVNALPAASRVSDWPADIESGGANYTASAKLVRDKALQKDRLISDWPADIESGEASYVASAKLIRDKTVLAGTSNYVASVAAGGNALEFTLGDGSTVDYSPSFEMSYPSTMVFKDPASSKISFWGAGMITPSMLGVFVSKPGSTYANMDKEAIYYAGTPTMANDEKRKYYFWDGYHYTRVADADNLGIFMGPPLDYADAEVGHVYMADAGYTFMQPTTNAADKTRFYLWDGTRYTTVADAADYTDVVRTARTVNGYPLSANVQLQASDVGATTRAESDARYGSQFAEATADLQGGVRLGRGLYPVLHQNSMSVKYYTKYRACNLKIGSTSHPCYISEYDAQNYNTSGIGAIYQSVGTYPNEYMQPFQGARVVVSGTVQLDITVYFGTTAYELEIGSATLQSENACRVVEPSIFEAFSTTRGYAYGQTCLKDGKLYRCIISNYYSGKTWNASYWSEIKEAPTNGVTATDGELYVNGSSLTVNSRLEGLASHKQNIIQINTPAGMNAEDRTFDDFIQYTGTTTASFKQGHFYRMATYSPRVWQEVETMDAYTKTDTDSAITSGIRTVLSSRVFDFQGGTNFAQRLYTTLTNIIDILGGSVTNTPSF